MTRRDFTKNIAILITEMVNAGDMPIADFCKRTDEEQKRMYDAGLSKCDGVVRVSKHQLGKALDIYLCRDNGNGGVIVDYSWDKGKSSKWHARWEQLGGNPLVTFHTNDSKGNAQETIDHPHFECD